MSGRRHLLEGFSGDVQGDGVGPIRREVGSEDQPREAALGGRGGGHHRDVEDDAGRAAGAAGRGWGEELKGKCKGPALSFDTQV